MLYVLGKRKLFFFSWKVTPQKNVPCLDQICLPSFKIPSHNGCSENPIVFFGTYFLYHSVKLMLPCRPFFYRRQNPMKGGVGFYWKKRDIFPPCDLLFFQAKNFFSDFLKNFQNFFSMKLTVKNFRIFFTMQVSSKKFFNSLKMTTKKFRNFFQ